MTYLLLIEAVLLSAGWIIHAQELTYLENLTPLLILVKTITVSAVSYRINSSYHKLTKKLKINEAKKLNETNVRNIITTFTVISLFLWKSFFVLPFYVILEIYNGLTKKIVAKIAY